MKDTFGFLLHELDTIAYVTRKSSTVHIKKGWIDVMGDNYIIVYSLSNKIRKRVKITNTNNVIKLRG